MQISRVRRSKNEAKRSYDRLSHFYDLLAGSSEVRFMHLGLQMMDIANGETVLEIGCGTGKALVELCHQAGKDGKIYALDLSRGMLRKSHSRLAAAGLQDRVILLEGNGSRLPYKSGMFDAIFICFTLELFDTPEIPVVLQECSKVLVPGGRLGAVILLKTDPPGVPQRLYEWFHQKFPSFVDCRPIDAQGMIQSAGFSIVKHQVGKMWGLPVELAVAHKG
jgi:demethylmenaquinone methyltransferase/2-methoxy-6-polyprenyl-1,4-benzoquinol methylase